MSHSIKSRAGKTPRDGQSVVINAQNSTHHDHTLNAAFINNGNINYINTLSVTDSQSFGVHTIAAIHRRHSVNVHYYFSESFQSSIEFDRVQSGIRRY